MACSSCEIGIDEITWSHGYSVRVAVVLGDDRDGPAVLVVDRRRPGCFITTVQPCASTRSRQRSHIIPGPYFGYWNSSISEVMSFWFALAASSAVGHRRS